MSDPILMRSELTNRVYIVTSYQSIGEGRIAALTKYDVTEQFDAIVDERTKEAS